MSNAEQAEVHAPPSEASEPSLTETLASARQAQNLSVTDVANRLKLSVQQVEALEQGAYDRLPGPVFVRGFTRNYARLLKLDAEAMVRAVDAQLPRAAPEQATTGEANIPMPGKNGTRWPVIAGLAAVVFLGAALVDVLWPETPPNAASAPEAPAAPVTAPPSAMATAPESTAAPAPAASTLTAAETEPVRPAAAVPATYQQAPEQGRTLRLEFDQASWVQVRDTNGKVVLEGLFQPGASREIAGKPPLALIIGNAPGVRVIYGEKSVDLAPHTRVAVARLKLE